MISGTTRDKPGESIAVRSTGGLPGTWNRRGLPGPVRIFLLFLLSCFPSTGQAGEALDFPDFVITTEKFQSLVWRDFLIEFPGIYSKRNHRVFKSGTVDFHGSDQRPVLALFADQRMEVRPDGLIVRITRLGMRSISGTVLFDIVIVDTGSKLGEHSLDRLLTGDLPLDLTEPTLRQKTITVSGERTDDIRIRFRNTPGRSGGIARTVDVMWRGIHRFAIREALRDDSREVSWTLGRGGKSEGGLTLLALKTRIEGMTFGSEAYRSDGHDTTPEIYQRLFSRSGIQGYITGFQKTMVETVRSVGCYPECREDESEEE